MMDKSFYNPRRSPRGINLLAFGAQSLSAFAVPRDSAQIPYPTGSRRRSRISASLVKDPVAAILLDEQITTVRDSGEIDSLYRRVCKIFGPKAARASAASSSISIRTPNFLAQGLDTSHQRQGIPK